MKARCVITLFAALSIGVSGCDKPVSPKVPSFTYPLALGNTWIYERQMVTDFRGKKPNDTLKYAVTATIDRVDTILPGIYSYRFVERNTDPGGSDPSDAAKYASLPDGMYRLQHLQDPKRVGQSRHSLPKSSSGDPEVIFGGRQYRDISDLLAALSGTTGIITAGQSEFSDTLALILPYPQGLGQQWISWRKGSLYSWDGIRTIVGGETVKVATAWLDCHVIRLSYDPPLEGVDVLDYVAAEGLVRRAMTVTDVVIPTYQNPIDGDTADIVITLDLRAFELN